MSAQNQYLMVAVAALAIAAGAALLVGGAKAQVPDPNQATTTATTTPTATTTVTGTSTDAGAGITGTGGATGTMNTTGTGVSPLTQPAPIPQGISGATTSNDVISSALSSLAQTDTGAGTGTATGTAGTGTVTGTVETAGTFGVPTAAPLAATPLSFPAPGTTPAPMVVDVRSDGSALIRGTVQSSGANAIVVNSWGGMWTIRTFPGSTVIPSGAALPSDLSAIRVGDFVGAEGTLANDQMFTLNATLVRDWTTNPFVAPETTTPSVTPGAPEEGTTTPPGTTTPEETTPDQTEDGGGTEEGALEPSGAPATPAAPTY